MTVTIVRGVAGKAGPSSASVSSSTTNNQGQNQQSVQAVASSLAFTSDAVVANVRLSAKQAVQVERIKDSREARKLSDEIAARILSKEDADFDAHSDLDSISAREHLTR